MSEENKEVTPQSSEEHESEGQGRTESPTPCDEVQGRERQGDAEPRLPEPDMDGVSDAAPTLAGDSTKIGRP